jgi:hypothetical protein
MLESLKLDYPPKHAHSCDAGKTLNWVPCDDERSFLNNMQDPQKEKYIKSMGWETAGCFTYKMNSQGFRTDELEYNPESFIALGCSFTAGIGLPIETVWPSLLSQKMNRQVFNLGVGGASADTVFRIADYWIPLIQPKFVALLVPPIDRFEVMEYNNGNGNIIHPCDTHKDQFIKQWYASEENSKNNARKNILAIQHICYNLNIPIFVVDSKRLHSRDHARDFMHQGPQGHTELIKLFLEQGIENV